MVVTGSRVAASGTLRVAFNIRSLHHCISWRAPHSLIPTGYYTVLSSPFKKLDTPLMDDIWIGGLDKYPFFELGLARTSL